MERRKFILGAGSTAIGASAVIGSGAFTAAEVERDVEVEVVGDADAYLAIEEGEENGEYVVGDDIVGLDFTSDNPTDAYGEGISDDSTYVFDDVLRVQNQGTQEVNFSIDRLGDGYFTSNFMFYWQDDDGDREALQSDDVNLDNVIRPNTDSIDDYLPADYDGGVDLEPGDEVEVGVVLHADDHLGADNNAEFNFVATAT